GRQAFNQSCLKRKFNHYYVQEYSQIELIELLSCWDGQMEGVSKLRANDFVTLEFERDDDKPIQLQIWDKTQSSIPSPGKRREFIGYNELK
ncbi:unnamed protein product, partial [Didymodactylos carnosus]